MTFPLRSVALLSLEATPEVSWLPLDNDPQSLAFACWIRQAGEAK